MRPVVTIAYLVAGAAGAACATNVEPSPPSPAAGSPRPTGPALQGPWVVSVTETDRLGLRLRMTFEARGGGGWQAYSRPGALRPMIGGRRYLLGRLLRKLPPRGAVVHVGDGIVEQRGDSALVRGTLTSPVFGRLYLVGVVSADGLRAELRRDSLGAVVGRVDGRPATDDRPVADYRQLAAAVRRAVADSIYDPALVERPEWQAFFRELDTRLAAARDDGDAMLAFNSLAPRLGVSHFMLYRSPDLAGLTIDSLLRRSAGDPDALVAVSFPAPGVARVRVTRWDRVTAAIDRAFTRIDSARAHTLILDIRGNGGGDATSMSPVTHLTRDSIPAGLFLGHAWYSRHRGLPSKTEMATLPVLTESDGASVVRLIRERGALTGIVPPREPYFAGTVYLLTDRRTGSASEPLAHLLKERRLATLVGERTAGAMLSGPPHSIGDGWVLVLPEADYYTADGVRLEGRGVTPHVTVPSGEAYVAVAERIRARDAYAGALLLGAANAGRQRWRTAERWYREARRLGPDSAAPAVGLGGVLQERSRWDEVFALYERALRKNPRDLTVLYQVGRAAARSGRHLDRGEEALRTYLEQPAPPGEPSHAAAHWRLGMIRQARGDRDGARREYQAALQLEPANSQALAALAALP